MGWSDEEYDVDYKDVPEDVKRAAVKQCVIRVTCPECGHEWYDRVVAGHNHGTECPECESDYTVAG